MSASVTVDTKAFCAGLIELGQEIKKTSAAVVKQTANYAKSHADKTQLFRDRSGLLRKSTVVTVDRPQFRSAIVNAAPYALYIEDGAKPHQIVARNRPYLRFYWEKVGAWVAFRRVNHPGNAPRPFFRAASDAAEPVFDAQLSRAVDESIARFHRGP